MEYLTAAQAAARLGLETRSAYDLIGKALGNINEGKNGPALIPAVDVEALAFRRRHDALRRRGNEVDYARVIKATLHPATNAPLRADGRPDGAALHHLLSAPRGKQALRTLIGGDAFALWGPATLTAAAMEAKPGVCRTCWARLTASVHGTRQPDDSEATRILLGSPCGEDVKAWAAQREDARQQLDAIKARALTAAAADRQRKFRTEYESAAKDLQRAQDRFAAVQASAAPRTRTAAATPKPYPVKNCGCARGVPCSCRPASRTAAAHICGQGTTVCAHCEAGR